MHRALERMRKQLNMDAHATAEQTGPTADIQHCVGLGKRTVGDIMSAYHAFSKAAFRVLPRIVRHNLVLNAVSHTGGMRYGHFPDRDYSIDAFVRDAEGSYRLITDWHRYAGRRMYCIEFPAVPRYDAQIYELRWPDGSVFDTITAATILDWHFEQLREAGERKLFQPTRAAGPYRRADRQAWLRAAVAATVPAKEASAHARIHEITPHSFRAGFAADLYAEGVDLQRIASLGRWANVPVTRLYAERPRFAASRVSHTVNLLSKRL